MLRCLKITEIKAYFRAAVLYKKCVALFKLIPSPRLIACHYKPTISKEW